MPEENLSVRISVAANNKRDYGLELIEQDGMEQYMVFCRFLHLPELTKEFMDELINEIAHRMARQVIRHRAEQENSAAFQQAKKEALKIISRFKAQD